MPYRRGSRDTTNMAESDLRRDWRSTAQAVCENNVDGEPTLCAEAGKPPVAGRFNGVPSLEDMAPSFPARNSRRNMIVD